MGSAFGCSWGQRCGPGGLHNRFQDTRGGVGVVLGPLDLGLGLLHGCLGVVAGAADVLGELPELRDVLPDEQGARVYEVGELGGRGSDQLEG